VEVAPEGPQRGDLAQTDFSGNSDKTAGTLIWPYVMGDGIRPHYPLLADKQRKVVTRHLRG
jgi:hypothetical protein